EKREEKFRSREDPTGYLSKLELQMLAYIGEGKSSDEIAGNLHLAVGTVRNYISTVMRKTGTRNRSQLARCALFYGLVPERNLRFSELDFLLQRHDPRHSAAAGPMVGSRQLLLDL
ncbi:MAG: helix-turn-helix transcriptional regulator, partial [Treponema sp.]|nr:helix-turn-helix transcriptional regulator [Treponema sp.]